MQAVVQEDCVVVFGLFMGCLDMLLSDVFWCCPVLNIPGLGILNSDMAFAVSGAGGCCGGDDDAGQRGEGEQLVHCNARRLQRRIGVIQRPRGTMNTMAAPGYYRRDI